MTDSAGKPVPPTGASPSTAANASQQPAGAQPAGATQQAGSTSAQATASTASNASTASSAAATPVQPAGATQPVQSTGAQPAGQAAGQPAGTTQPAGAAQAAGTQPMPTYAAQKQAQAQAKAAKAKAKADMKSAKAQAKRAKKGGGFFRGVFGGIVGTVVVLAVLACLWTYTPVLNSFKSGSTGTNAGGTITINGSDEATVAEAVAAKDLSSVVTIYVFTDTGSSWSQLFGNSGNSGSSSTASALGSGVIVKKDNTYSYIVTNYHVVENISRAVVSVGGEQVEAESVGYDEKSDLAVIKIKKTDTTVAEWGDSSDLAVGQWVAAIGSPYGYEQTLTTGIVSALYRSDVLSSSSSGLGGTTVYTDMIQTDAAINPGNSGGGLFDDEGKLIGINTYISSTSESSAGLGFAIPQSTAQSEVETLISGQSVTHAFLGILMGSDTTSGSSGITVEAVYKDTAAAQAGLKTGDVITKIDGNAMSSASDVRKAVAAKKVGDEISITYTRNGQEATGTAKLGDDSSSKSEYADGGSPATNNSSNGSSGNSGNSGNSGSNDWGYSWGYGNSGNSGNSGSGNLFDFFNNSGNSGSSGNSGNSNSGNSGSSNSNSGSSNSSGSFWK